MSGNSVVVYVLKPRIPDEISEAFKALSYSKT